MNYIRLGFTIQSKRSIYWILIYVFLINNVALFLSNIYALQLVVIKKKYIFKKSIFLYSMFKERRFATIWVWDSVPLHDTLGKCNLLVDSPDRPTKFLVSEFGWLELCGRPSWICMRVCVFSLLPCLTTSVGLFALRHLRSSSQKVTHRKSTGWYIC